MFFRVHVGEAGFDGEPERYELSTNVADSQPIVHDTRTGKWFTLGWQEIIEMAEEAGIGEPDEEGSYDRT